MPDLPDSLAHAISHAQSNAIERANADAIRVAVARARALVLANAEPEPIRFILHPSIDPAEFIAAYLGTDGPGDGRVRRP